MQYLNFTLHRRLPHPSQLASCKANKSIRILCVCGPSLAVKKQAWRNNKAFCVSVTALYRCSLCKPCKITFCVIVKCESEWGGFGFLKATFKTTLGLRVASFFFCPFAVACIYRMLPYGHSKQVGSQSDGHCLQQVTNVATYQSVKESFTIPFLERNSDSARTENTTLMKFPSSDFWMRTSASVPVAVVTISGPSRGD